METAIDLPLQQLGKYWGYESFRPLQREAIDCALQRRDSVVVLPTGGGKSVCYQVPALCGDRNLAVVVSPLIALMKDQVDNLVASGIAAASLNSAMSAATQSSIVHQIQRGELRLLYVSPERLVQPNTIELLKQSPPSYFAIDEAHCISSWGHDFRPEYRQLSTLKEQFPRASVHAFTATATPQVRDDIAQQLNLQQAEKLVGSFYRPNLTYHVHRRHNVVTQLQQTIDRYPDQSGIIYCISRKEVDNVAATLNELGYRAKPYHAGMSDADRSQNQEDFINEKMDIIVATVAFGMGIDKSSVRYVIHNGMPKSLEAYQQESGRAGRDGLPAECSLLFSGGDLMLWKRMQDGQPAAKALLESMYSYCTRSICRHRMLVEYFGQQFEHQDCGACDVCLGNLNEVADPLILAQKILSCVYRVEQRFGSHHVAAVLTGSNAKRILELGHEKLSTHGLLSEHSKQQIVDWIEQLLGQRFLGKVGEYSVLKITDTGTQLLRGEITPKLYQMAPQPKSSSARAAEDWEGADPGLFEELRALRRAIAEEKELPPFVIFHDASLRDMARMRPSNLDGFANVQGVGEKKLSDYGQPFVECIANYCAQHQLEMDNDVGTITSILKPKPKMMNAAKQQAFEMFASGNSVEHVAAKIGRAESTTNGYLGEYIRSRGITDPSPWVDPETARAIRSAAEQVGELDRLAPIRELLGEDYSYNDIRIVVECMLTATQ